MNIADRIQTLRKAKGLSQEELADKLGVSRQAVSKWESEQSIPDIDRIIIMSDFFEVTTDYILKGIEAEKPAAGRWDAKLFAGVATGLNFIGLILACAVWYENQTATALVLGAVVMLVGCLNFAIGQSAAARNAEKAKGFFWTFNIWILSFMPLSLVYNALFSYSLAPYPLLFGPYYILQYPAFWLVYIGICLSVTLIEVRKMKQNP